MNTFYKTVTHEVDKLFKTKAKRHLNLLKEEAGATGIMSIETRVARVSSDLRGLQSVVGKWNCLDLVRAGSSKDTGSASRLLPPRPVFPR